MTVQGDLMASVVYYTRNLVGTSDDRIKSHEEDITGATETLNNQTPKIYDKPPFFQSRFGNWRYGLKWCWSGF